MGRKAHPGTALEGYWGWVGGWGGGLSVSQCSEEEIRALSFTISLSLRSKAGRGEAGGRRRPHSLRGGPPPLAVDVDLGRGEGRHVSLPLLCFEKGEKRVVHSRAA
jgi:hypothetical protein